MKVINIDEYKKRIEYNSSSYIEFEILYEVINIINVYVDASYRNKGVATSMFKYLIENYKNENNKIMLEVSENNIVALKFYEKLGFKNVSVRKKYYKDGSNAIIMELV